MERGAGEISIGLLDDNDVDGARERGWIDFIVELCNGREEVPDRIHDVGSLGVKGAGGTKKGRQKETITKIEGREGEARLAIKMALARRKGEGNDEMDG